MRNITPKEIEQAKREGKSVKAYPHRGTVCIDKFQHFRVVGDSSEVEVVRHRRAA